MFPVNSSSSTSTSKNKLKPSMTRDFELNICREEEQTDISSCKYSAVIGCDEAGRGPLCGPVVAAAAWVAADSLIEHGIADSKATTEAQREATYEILVNHPGVKYAVVRIEHDEIDEINILQASLKAMRLACTGVLEQLQNEEEPLDPATCLCLVDGNKCPQDMPVKTKCIIKVKVRSRNKKKLPIVSLIILFHLLMTGRLPSIQYRSSQHHR